MVIPRYALVPRRRLAHSPVSSRWHVRRFARWVTGWARTPFALHRQQRVGQVENSRRGADREFAILMAAPTHAPVFLQRIERSHHSQALSLARGPLGNAIKVSVGP